MLLGSLLRQGGECAHCFSMFFPRCTSSEAWVSYETHLPPPLRDCIDGTRRWCAGKTHILNMASFPGTFLCSMNMLWIFIAQFDFIPQPEVELGPNVSFTGHAPWIWKTSLLLFYLCFLLWADGPLSQARGGHLWKLQLVSSTCSARSAVQGTGPGGGWF